MMRETPANDPRLMWQSQRRDHPVMSVEEVRVMAQKVHAKVRRNLIIAFVLGLLLLVLGTLALASCAVKTTHSFLEPSADLKRYQRYVWAPIDAAGTGDPRRGRLHRGRPQARSKHG